MSFESLGLRRKSAVIRGLETAWLDNERDCGQAVLFLHGFPDTPSTWLAQAAEFAPKYRLILPYGRGVGASKPPSAMGRYSAHSILLDHLDILRRADPGESAAFHVVGHDLGGVHAWMLASHADPRIRTVAVINSAHPRQYLRRAVWPRQVAKSWYAAALQVPFLPEALLTLFSRRILKQLEADGWRPPAPDITLRDFEGAVLNALNQYRQFARDIPKFLNEKAGPADMPVLVISSAGDRYLEEASGPEFSDLARRVTIRVIPGKHWLHHEQAPRVNRLLEDFWKEHASGGG